MPFMYLRGGNRMKSIEFHEQNTALYDEDGGRQHEI